MSKGDNDNTVRRKSSDLSTDAASLMLAGCIIANPIFIAASFTGDGQGVLLLPFGLSGCVITATMLCFDVANDLRQGTANAGVPINTTFIIP